MNQFGSLDDQVRTVQGHMRRPAIGEEFKFADFVNHRALAGFAQQRAHVAGDDQRSRCGVKLLGTLQDLHSAARPRQQ